MISSCPICNNQVLTVKLKRHANSHFEDDEVQMNMELEQQIAVVELNSNAMDAPEHFKGSTTDYHSRGGLSSIGGRLSPYGNVFYLVGAQTRSKIHQIEDGIMDLLRSCLESEGCSSTSIICGHVDHYQSLSSGDEGWECGWKNIQMRSSHLLKQRPKAKEVLFGGCGFVPDISSLQMWLEIAWSKHFDTIGAGHFDNKVYGSKKWVGTTECATLLRSFGLRARIVDFCSTESHVPGPMDKFLIKNNSTPKSSSSELCQEDAESIRDQQVLVDWVWK